MLFVGVVRPLLSAEEPLALPALPPSLRPSALIGHPLSERQPLIVGAITDSFPYCYAGEDQKWTGFAVDLLDAVTRVMNLKIQRVVLPGREHQERFRRGEFDLLQSFSQTAERETYVEFSVPFLTLQGAIFVRKRGSPIKTLADFNGRRFAIIGVSSIAERFLRDSGIIVQGVAVDSAAEGLGLVESGECAGVFASQLTALSTIEREKFRNVVQFGPPLADYDIRHCFAVHKGDAQLLARLNEGLAILHRNGEFDRIYRHWFSRFGSPLIALEQVVAYAAAIFALAFAAALGGFLHQRALRRRIARQAEELSVQQALLQTLYDNIPMAMCVLASDPDGFRVLSINRQAEAYVGLPAAQAAKRLLSELPMDSEWTTHLAELLQRGLSARGYVREERRLALARKRLIFTLVPMTPDTAGHTRLCVLAEDITERRNLDEEIAQSRKLRAVGELVGGIAHEFNNLLTPIMLKIGEIQLDWAHDERLVGETRLISEAVKRSAELTRRLLTFGRKSDARIEEVRLASVVDTCFSLLRLTMDRRIVWQQAIPPELPPLVFNATDLNQIILNLVINARDTLLEKLALQPGEWTPSIRVEALLLPAGTVTRLEGPPSVRQVLGWQRLTIRDNGMGMSPEVRERIFEPFFTTKDVGQGTGLGLATVWHLVTAISGRIEVESAPGQGTAFHVFLPMIPSARPNAIAQPPARPADANHARIFVAEDDPMVANAITTSLRRAGHTVTHLTDGAASWQQLRDHGGDFDLLILDVNMPGLDGIELAQRMRGPGRYAGPIMIISGRLSSDDLKQLADTQIDSVLNKPFAIGELLGAVRDCLHPSGYR